MLAQTFADIEVIVVSDGPDPETAAAIAVLCRLDARLRYFELPVNRGPASARNMGVASARGQWFAFLDDDDLWLPRKLEAQLALVDRGNPTLMIGCRSIYRHNGRDDIWPARPIGPDEDIAEYILLRKGLLERPGIVSIQTLLVHSSIVRQIPFTDWNDHEDWAWLLEAWHNAGARLRFVWEPLAIYNIQTDAASRSRRTNWLDSLLWAEANRAWISDRALCSFLATKVALKAKRAGAWRGLSKVSALTLRNHPSLLDLAFLAGIALLPSALLNAAWKRSLKAAIPATSPR